MVPAEEAGKRHLSLEVLLQGCLYETDNGWIMVRPVIAIFGPTASGKSAVAAAVADRIPSEIVSADAMQAYRGLPILTNQGPGHARLVGIWPLEHDGSVGEFAALAHAAIDEILAAGRTPLVVGGTGLYLRAALAELEVPPAPAPGARERWERVYDAGGATAAHARLAELDPDAAAAVHPNDRRRVVRALELAEAGSSLARGDDRLWSGETRHPTLIVGLEVPKDELERRIEQRTRAMFDAGVEEEVGRALAGPISPTARRALGLDEVSTLPREVATSAIVVATRRYAAYQRKWMRRVPGLVSVRADRPAEEVADEIVRLAGARERLRSR
jgi:tRNA dimethylallyltransferase